MLDKVQNKRLASPVREEITMRFAVNQRALPADGWMGRPIFSRGVPILVLLLLNAGSPEIYAQALPVRHWDLTERFDRYIHESWDTEQGLPGAVVNTIAQTPDGYIWLGTQSGLVRFNGVAFLVQDRYNTPVMKNEFIRRLCVARDSTLWIGTDHAGILSLQDGVLSARNMADSVSANAVRLIMERKDHSVWAAITGAGVWKRTPSGKGDDEWQGVTLSRPLKSVWCAFEDADSSLWLGEKGAIVHMVGSADIWYGAPYGLPETQVLSILRDTRGTLLIGTQQRGLYMLREGGVAPLPGAAMLHKASVTCLCNDEGGGVWIGTAEMGLLYYDGSTVTQCMASLGSSPLQVGSIMPDNQGNLWFGTHGDGLHRLRRSVVRYLRVVEPGVSSQVWGVTMRGEEIWIGTRGSGVRQFADGRMRRPSMPAKLSRMTVGALLPEPDGTLWIGGESGLYRMSGGRIRELLTPDGQPFNNPFGLLRDHNGVMWIGGEGLFRMAGGTISKLAGLPADISINFLLEDRQGTIWIASDANGVGRLAGGKFSFFSTDSGLTSNTILCLYEDGEGGIWAGTQGGGINRFRDGRWKSLTTSNGLLNNYVNTIMRADGGEIWMSTNQGLFGTSERSVIDATEGRTTTVQGVSIEARNGLRSTEFAGGLQSCSAKSPDGTLWFASVQGLVGYNPGSAMRTYSPPPVKIEAMEVDGTSMELRTLADLGPGVRSVQFEYAGLSFVVPTATRYRYYLEGYDEDWIDGKSQRRAAYTRLAPGVYVFHVTDANSDAVWNPAGAALRFRILPFFWQTAPFRILCVLVILGIVFGAYRMRVWQILAREKRLQLRVDEAIANIKVLHGLIPICANCKKIRDDKGFWNDLTKYIHEHSSAVLSHGICPDCMEELYGAELRNLKQKAKRTSPAKDPKEAVDETGHDT